MDPVQHVQKSEIERRIESALSTLSDIRNHALDVLRFDDARWIIRRQREDLLQRTRLETDVLSDWTELARTEKDALIKEYNWIANRAKLDFAQLSHNLIDSFSSIQDVRTSRPVAVPQRVLTDVPEEFQRVLLHIPSYLSRQFVIPNYQELSFLNPRSIDAQLICRVISEYEPKRNPPFSIRRLFEREVKALLLERSGTVIGTLLWDSTNFGDGPAMELLGLWVTPLERRDGVASALLKRAAKIASRAGKDFLSVRLLTPHSELRDVFYANGFTPHQSGGKKRTDTKVATIYRAKISDIFHSDECSSNLTNHFSMLCGGSEVAGALCRARRSFLRLHCPRPSQSRIFKNTVVNLHAEDQLSGKEHEITADRKISQLRYNAKLQSLRAQTRQIKHLTTPSGSKEISQSVATRYYSHILSDLSTESRPDDFCAAVTQLGTVQWKFVPTLSGKSINSTVSVLDEELVPHVPHLRVEPQHRGLISDIHDLHALVGSEEVVALSTSREKSLTGVSIGSLIDESLVFHQLVVDERYRRSGFGRSLVNAMIAHAVFLRAKSVIAAVPERNDAAVALFASCGFIAKLVPEREPGVPESFLFTLPLTQRR